MRLPLQGGAVDHAELTKMSGIFLASGFHYFDTVHGYVGGKSETALRECLTSRYPQGNFVLTDKLSTHHCNKSEEIRPLVESQLSACGMEYFDFYLMHARDRNIFQKFQRCHACETALKFQKGRQNQAFWHILPRPCRGAGKNSDRIHAD